MGWTKEGAEALTRENQSALDRLGYDPNTAPARPHWTPQEMQRAAVALRERLKKRPVS